MVANSGSLSGRNWVYPVLTSLSGNKSDRWIERDYTAETTKIGVCRYMNKLTFAHRHTYIQSDDALIRSYLATIGVGDKASIEKMLAIQGK